uniref:M4 family metallopeptidase n=1 Tax=Streptomyces sp. NRRL S-146 TaxID=1463884 RepID=UPI000568FDAB
MRSSSSRRGTSHRRTPHTPRRTAAVALFGVAVLMTAAVQGGTAVAAPEKTPPAASKAIPGSESVKLTPAQRAELIRKAEAGKAQTARDLGLGAKEKLVVRDVVKDADGTVHTRYERTYDGLPVLGGDLWAASGKPVLAYETVVGGLQKDGTPNELHVITDAATGKKLYEYQGIENGTGNTMYSGTVTLGTTQSGSTYNLTDGARGGHKTNNLNRGTSGTGTLFSGPDDVWGNGSPSNAETAGADAHYGAALTWDYYKNVHGRSGIKGDGVGAYSRVHYGNNYVNAFWSDSCFCMTYGDGAGNTNPLTSIDVAGHEMTHGVTSNTAGLVYSGESGGLNEAT